MIKDDQWPTARLIPISSGTGIEAQERRAVSALLAVIKAVPEFGRALLKPLGAPSGRIETFIEIPFKMDGHTVRPDGVISVTRAGKTWGALVEAKTQTNALSSEQMNLYLDLARDLDFDAVLSISNHYVTSSTEYPVAVDRRKLKRVALHHWSWIDVLTEAIVQEEHRGVSDPDQAYILGELIRYLSDTRSGALTFEGMGPHWTRVRDGVRDQTLRKTDPAVTAVAARWDDLVSYLALNLTKDLGEAVRQVLPPTQRNPQARVAALTEGLVSRGRLAATLRIPNAVGDLEIEADLRARQVVASTRIDAPRQGRAKGRVSWLLKQLADAPENVKVEALVTRAGGPAATLKTARATPDLLYPEAPREIRQFAVSLSRNMGLNRDAGRSSFVASVIAAGEEFYRDVLQNLRAWRATPPKLRRPEEAVDDLAERLDVPAAAIDEHAAEDAIGDAAGETTSGAGSEGSLTSAAELEATVSTVDGSTAEQDTPNGRVAPVLGEAAVEPR